MADTALVLSGVGLLYAAREVTQTLEYIDEAKGHLVRTVNGGIADLTPPQFKKYKSTITTNSSLGRNPPSLDGVFPGDALTVDCIQELSYLTSGGSAGRMVVSGSSRTDGAQTFYRPQLSMIVVDFKATTDEWGAQVGWQLDLIEA